MVDDILDITATTEQLGKTAGKDLASSKTTYPSILGLEQVSPPSPFPRPNICCLKPRLPDTHWQLFVFQSKSCAPSHECI